MSRLIVTVSLSIGLSLSPLSAEADLTKAQCIEANTRGQDLVREGRLLAARDQLRSCAGESCPALVRDDCTRRMNDVERAQPTIVFDAKDTAGRDLSVVHVTIDGSPLADKLDGTALPVDPGEHVFAFTVLDQASVVQTFVLKEGDKERRERVVIGRPAPPLPGPAPKSNTLSANPFSSERKAADGPDTQRLLGLVAGGAGVASIALGSAFGLMTLSQVSQQQADCASATDCQRFSEAVSDRSTAMTDRTISTVGFIAGGVLLASGVVLFLTANRPPRPGAVLTSLIVPQVGRQGAGVSWLVDF